MKENKSKSLNTSCVDFTKQTPKPQIGESENTELYKKAFPDNDKGCSNEYTLNTSSWD